MTGMSDLGSFQAAMAAAMIEGGPASAELAALIEPSSIPNQARIQIHQNNYRETLSTVIVNQFPTIMAFVGEGFLKAVAGAYCKEYPPKEAALSGFGRGFPEFLRGFKPAQQIPYIADLAELEWFVTAQQNVTAEDILDAADVRRRFDTGDLALARQVRLIVSEYPVLRFWMVAAGQLSPESVRVDQGGEAALVAQIDGGVQILPIDAPRAQFLLEGCKKWLQQADHTDCNRFLTRLANSSASRKEPVNEARTESPSLVTDEIRDTLSDWPVFKELTNR